MKKDNADVGTNKKIKAILLDTHRSLNDAATLEKLTAKLPSFSKFSIDQRVVYKSLTPRNSVNQCFTPVIPVGPS
jgi:hypothetical protein